MVDSGVRRDLAATAYNERVAECRAAAEALGVRSLREATGEQVETLSGTLRRRARHVVGENEHVLAAADALQTERLGELGRLFRQSHKSLADDFEASTPELNALVQIAEATDGVIAARLTGAGFGGCTVNLVHGDAEKEAGREIVKRYSEETRLPSRFWTSNAANGGERVPC